MHRGKFILCPATLCDHAKKSGRLHEIELTHRDVRYLIGTPSKLEDMTAIAVLRTSSSSLYVHIRCGQDAIFFEKINA